MAVGAGGATVTGGTPARGEAGGPSPTDRAPARALWVNGRIVRGGEATLSLFDRGARDGEGLFETLRVESGQPLDWDRHMERLVLSAAEMGFPVPPAPSRLRHGLAQVLAAEGLSDAAARITVTRGIPGGRPTRTGCWIEAEALRGRLWPGTRRGEASAIFSKRPYHPGALGRFKTTSRLAYALAREEARAARVDETLLCTSEGDVLEGSVSNVFVVERGEVLTPPLSRGILPGLARRGVLEACRALGITAREAPLAREALFAAEEVFLTNSIQQVVALGVLEGRALAGRESSRLLLEAWRSVFAARP